MKLLAAYSSALDMTNKGKSAWLIAGAIVGLIGFWIPGVYGVGFSPPAGSPYAKINLGSLPGFGGGALSVVGAHGAVYNGYSGPVDFHLTLIALLVIGVVGLAGRMWNLKTETGFKIAHYLGYTVKIGSILLIVGEFIWAFRFDRTPPAITDAFVRALGGGPSAVAASQYLSGSLGLGALIMFFGLLLATVGIAPKIGCAIVSLFVISFVVLLVAAN